jgi:hypothetical protein
LIPPGSIAQTLGAPLARGGWARGRVVGRGGRAVKEAGYGAAAACVNSLPSLQNRRKSQ